MQSISFKSCLSYAPEPMFLDELFGDHVSLPDFHHSLSVFASKSSSASTSLSTPAAIGIGAGVASAVGAGAFITYRTVARWSLRDSGVQVPEFDPSTTLTGRAGSTTPTYPGMHGETGDPTEFLSPTPTGKVRKNQRARFF